MKKEKSQIITKRTKLHLLNAYLIAGNSNLRQYQDMPKLYQQIKSLTTSGNNCINMLWEKFRSCLRYTPKFLWLQINENWQKMQLKSFPYHMEPTRQRWPLFLWPLVRLQSKIHEASALHDVFASTKLSCLMAHMYNNWSRVFTSSGTVRAQICDILIASSATRKEWLNEGTASCYSYCINLSTDGENIIPWNKL